MYVVSIIKQEKSRKADRQYVYSRVRKRMREREARYRSDLTQTDRKEEQLKKSRKSPERVSDILLCEKIYVPRSRRRET